MVTIYRYATKGSFDSFCWQIVETKARFINQIMRGDTTTRSIDNFSEDVLSYAEIKAISSGNPLIMRKVQIDSEIQKLQMLEASYVRQRYHIQDSIVYNDNRISQLNRYIDNLSREGRCIITGKRQ